jgi:hypothetical protein
MRQDSVVKDARGSAGLHAENAATLSAQAIRLCVRGDVEPGVDLYRRALAASGGSLLPVGVHVKLLAARGLGEAAALVQEAGVKIGADVAAGWLLPDRDPRRMAAEYEGLFESGVGNAQMMANYMACLSLAGNSRQLAAVAAPALLFRQTRLSVDGALEPFLRRVGHALRSAKTRQFQEAGRSIRHMSRVLKTHTVDDPDIVRLHVVVRSRVAEYIKDAIAAGHVISSWLPQEFELSSWGVISEGTGYNVPHIHGGCWVVGIAYIEGEDPAVSGTGDAGLLRVGAGARGDPACPGWPDFTVAPVPGTLVLMPSYYTHWTMPLGAGGSRISMAFNAVAGQIPRDRNAAPGEIAAEV